MTNRGTWTELVETSLSRESLNAVLANQLPAVRIRNFAAPSECDAFANAVHEVGCKFYSVARRIGYIGLAQYEYRWDRPREDYFRDAAEANKQQQALIERSFDVVGRLMEVLRPHTSGAVRIAEEEGLGCYYAGIARLASEGVDLHADWAPLNSPAYNISQIDAHLGWNFYAQELIEGGETIVHNAPWNPTCSPGEIPKSYGLDHSVVAGAKTYTFKPNVGDVVIFNTRNPHEIAGGIAAPGRDRISMGSFIGRMPNGDLVLWS